jgi:hypothetical protein
VTFIPPHLVQEVVLSGEYTALRDEFGRYCMETNKYEYINEAFVVDDDVYEKDFQQWLDKYPDLPMTREELDEFLSEREARRAARKAKESE